MVGLGQILQVMQGQAGEAPAPVGVPGAKGQRGQPGVLVNAEQRKGPLDEGGGQVDHFVLMVEAHVEGCLGAEVERRIAKRQSAEAVHLAPVGRAVLPEVDVEPVVGLVAG